MAKKDKEPAVEKAPVAKDEMNGVTRPKSGTKTGRVWDIADAQSQELGAPAQRKGVLDAAADEGINTATAATQYGRWRKYHGLAAEVKEAKAEVTEATAPVVEEDHA